MQRPKGGEGREGSGRFEAPASSWWQGKSKAMVRNCRKQITNTQAKALSFVIYLGHKAASVLLLFSH